jgi:histidinol-phosphate aminotransferase
MMSTFWSPLVHTLHPYVAGEQPRIPDLIKLNTNECPYPPSEKALAAIREAAGDGLRLYPDPASLKLRQVIAARTGLTADEVFVGNGSDEVLAHAFLGLLKHDAPLLYPDVTYSFYPVYCGLYGIEPRLVPLDDTMQVRVDDYRQPSGGIILPNPNAPTGRALPLSEVERLIAEHPEQVVVIDEAYVDFGAESAVSLIPRYPNLLVIQTFSKSRALAGLRVGFALGQRPLIDALERVKDSFNSYPLDRLAQAGATAAYEDEAWFETTRHRIMASRDRLTAGLHALGFEVLPSQANFVFARHPDHAGADLAAALRQNAILVRHFAKPRISDFLRITIGTDTECARLLDVLTGLV